MLDLRYARVPYLLDQRARVSASVAAHSCRRRAHVRGDPMAATTNS
jgi:hypothetical protein